MMRKLLEKKKDKHKSLVLDTEEKLEIDEEANIISPQNQNQTQEAKGMTSEENSLKNEEKIPTSLSEVKRVLEEQMGLNTSFDIVLREMVFGTKKTGFLYMNGFAKDVILTEILKRLSYADEQVVDEHTFETFYEKLIPHIQVDKSKTIKKCVEHVLMGATALFIEGESRALLIDAKSFPARSTEEPDLERVVRGSRDGFVETLLTNVSLVRRRIRDPRLKLEIMQVGRRTNTDVCIGYISDIADSAIVEAVRDKIKSLSIDGIPLAEKQLEEGIIGNYWNPYPLVRYSERPDVAAIHLLEGHVIIFVDTSPSVMILPTTFFHHVQHVEEYRQTPFVGTYLRWTRFFGMIISLFLTPLWLLMVLDPSLKPVGLEFIGPEKMGHIPIILQFLFAEIGLDLMRMAAIHTPSPLVVAMGLIAAILIGEIAVKTGLYSNEVIFYLAISTIGLFATPSYEMSLANRIVRLFLLVSVAIFQVPGLVVGTTLWILLLAVQRSYNSPYLWPFIPFNAKAFLSILIRKPLLSEKTRLSLTKTEDGTRQPE